MHGEADMVNQGESSQGDSGLGVSMPVFLGIWLVCAVIAGLVWSNLVSETPASSTLVLTFPALIVVSLTFGIAGAGLAAAAIGVFRSA
jgi:uncharacterized protein (DUF983 family)